MRLEKAYVTDQGRVEAVRSVSFEVARGEIYTLLGPSGCGKTTILRCIAGLEVADEGEIELGGEPVFSSKNGIQIPTHERDVGMVFQSYAIWPHLTVFENVAFPLRYGPFSVSKGEITDRVMRALRLVQMDGMEHRPAPLLSGGQQQRVALARALVYEPAVLLLDEPLSNLDAKLRLGMRAELHALIKQLNVTVLYVTHDQEEALVLSDRLGVMRDGLILQEGAPRDIYLKPANPYVAAFVGRTNFFAGKVKSAQQNGVAVVACEFGTLTCALLPSANPLALGEAVWVAIRPEEVIVPSPSAGTPVNRFRAEVARTMFAGNRVQCEMRIGLTTCQVEMEGPDTLPVGAELEMELPADRIRVYRQEEMSSVL
jgi:iron(III) transport system ATP-binding protein